MQILKNDNDQAPCMPIYIYVRFKAVYDDENSLQFEAH